MARFSLTTRLALFWVFTLILAIALAALLHGVYDQGAGAQIAQAARATQDACLEIQRKFKWSAQNHSFDPKDEAKFQNALLEIILDRYQAVEGGFWSRHSGFVAYAFPTYEGTGTKRDVPDAEKDALAKVSAESLASVSEQTEFRRGAREAMVLTACPIEGASTETAAWTMTRTALGVGVAYDRFIAGLWLLLAFVLMTGLALSWLLYHWSRNLRRLEAEIQNHSIENLPELPLTPEAELNSLVAAFNALNARFRAAREDSSRLSRQLAQADRLASLGKMAAGIAHEIRNPLATVRLKFENALVQPAERLQNAAPVIFDQLARVERLVQMLLAMTQPFALKAREIEILPWLTEGFPALQKKAEDRAIHLIFQSEVAKWSFDPFHLGRALENLILNAISFTPDGGRIDVTVTSREHLLIINVCDSGPGVSAEMRPRLFEPFATGRPDGTGLGLLLVREIAEAHGGRVLEIPREGGACFQLEVPWLKSS